MSCRTWCEECKMMVSDHVTKDHADARGEVLTPEEQRRNEEEHKAKRERRIAELEAENNKLKAELVELKKPFTERSWGYEPRREDQDE